MVNKDKKLILLMKNGFLKSLYLFGVSVLRILPDKAFLSLMYRIRMHKKLNWNNPQTFNEKMQVLKLSRKGLGCERYVDKYAVRDYISNSFPNGEVKLIPLIGVFDSVDEIDKVNLPDEFVVKCTHDSGSVALCHSFSDWAENKVRFKKALKRDYFLSTRDYGYKKMARRLVIEEMMHNTRKGESNTLIDFKFYCFNGEPKYLYVSTDFDDHTKTKISFFNVDLSPAPFGRNDYEPLKELPFVPVNYDKMVEYARVLAKPFDFVRVDLYEIDEQIYFSELTFSPCNGMMPFKPVEYDKILGDMLVISER